VDREGSVVWFDDGIRNFGGRDDRERRHHSIRIFFTDFADQESSHTSTGTTSKGVRYLEPLETVTSFGFTSNNVENLVD
jgi:hypothetical protein